MKIPDTDRNTKLLNLILNSLKNQENQKENEVMTKHILDQLVEKSPNLTENFTDDINIIQLENVEFDSVLKEEIYKLMSESLTKENSIDISNLTSTFVNEKQNKTTIEPIFEDKDSEEINNLDIASFHDILSTSKSSLEQEKNPNILFCSHKSCKTGFKTKGQKYKHHDKIENECKNEKIHLVKLISKFNRAFETIFKRKNVKDFKESIHYRKFKETFAETVKTKIIDPIYMMTLLGDNLELE